MPCKCNQICNIGRLPGGPCRQPKCRLFFAASFHADLSGRVPCRPSSPRTPPPPGARLPGVTVPARYTQYRAGGIAAVTATATTTRTPQRHAATRTRHITSTAAHHAVHVMTSQQHLAVRIQTSNCHTSGHARGSSSDTATYHRGSTTIRPTPRTHANMERQHPATRSNFHTGSGQPYTTSTYGQIRPRFAHATPTSSAATATRTPRHKKSPHTGVSVWGWVTFLFSYYFHDFVGGFSVRGFYKLCF